MALASSTVVYVSRKNFFPQAPVIMGERWSSPVIGDGVVEYNYACKKMFIGRTYVFDNNDSTKNTVIWFDPCIAISWKRGYTAVLHFGLGHNVTSEA